MRPPLARSGAARMMTVWLPPRSWRTGTRDTPCRLAVWWHTGTRCLPAASGTTFPAGSRRSARISASDQLKLDLKRVMDQLARTVVFGLGRESGKAADHELFDDPAWKDVRHLETLKEAARAQLGTVGSGNHFVDLFEDEQGRIWVGVHFGSRGFGFKVASGFLNLAAHQAFDTRAREHGMDQPATVLSLSTNLGQDYWQAMTLAGKYAYAGQGFRRLPGPGNPRRPRHGRGSQPSQLCLAGGAPRGKADRGPKGSHTSMAGAAGDHRRVHGGYQRHRGRRGQL